MLRSEIMCWCQGIVKMGMDEVVRAFKKSGQLHLTTWTLDATPLAHIYSHRSLLNLKFILHTAYNSNKYNSSTYGAMCDPIRDDGSSKSRAVSKEKRPYVYRYWSWADIIRAFTVAIVHFLCLLAPFNYKWEALRFGLVLYALNALSITFSYHRNLAHRSFKLPKWLEYPCAYFAVFALQGDPLDWVSIHRFHHQFTDSDRDPHSPMEGFWFSHVWWICDTHYIKYKCGGRNNVMDLKKQWFYWFLRMTIGFHVLMFWTVLYLYGGLPYLTCGGGVGGVIGYHVTWLVNSACHIWGSRSWKTKDTSRNIWWLSLFTMGESWHNNHHAFESSARQGLEWWQIDITWYLIRLLEVLGLATDVKLPSEFQKQKMALAR